MYVSAFFKLLYNHTDRQYMRLVYVPNSNSHTAWYFIEEILKNNSTGPKEFLRDSFILQNVKDQKIDVWESSLIWEIK